MSDVNRLNPISGLSNRQFSD